MEEQVRPRWPCQPGTNSLIFGGSSYDGALSLSADGHPWSWKVTTFRRFLCVRHRFFQHQRGHAGSRAVGSVGADGSFTLNAITTKFSGSTIRAALADGAGILGRRRFLRHRLFGKQFAGGNSLNRVHLHAQSWFCEWQHLFHRNRLRSGRDGLLRRSKNAATPI